MFWITLIVRIYLEITGFETEEGFIRISIRDRGYGIPASLRDEIFNRDRMNRKHGGLGLLVVRHLVERSGGFVWIEDDEEKRGTEVVIELPLS